MCVGILLRSLAKLSGGEPVLHQLRLHLWEKKGKEKAYRKKKPQETMHGEVPLILSLLLLYFRTGFIVVLGIVLSFEFHVNVF